jgi:hypothetical protein
MGSRPASYWFLWHKGALSGPFVTREIVRDIAAGRTFWSDSVWGPQLGAHKWSRICDVPAFRASMPPSPNDEVIDSEGLADRIQTAQDAMARSASSDSASSPLSSNNSLKDALAPLAIQAARGRAAVSAMFQRFSSQTRAAQVLTLVPPDALPLLGPPLLSPSLLSTSTASSEVTRSASTALQKKRGQVWFMSVDGNEYGPLTRRELQLILKSGKLQGAVHVSRDGMENWQPVQGVAELDFMNPVDQLPSPYEPKPSEQRKNPRVPLIAEVRFSSGDGRGDPNSYVGICRNISARGILVLTKRCPTTTGVKVKLEIIPLESQGLNSFTAFAEIVRIVPGKNGFSTRFDMMPEIARQALNEYIRKQLLVLAP